MRTVQVTRVMLVDNHPILLDGTRMLVEAADDLLLVGVEATLAKAVGAVARTGPDVVVLNTSLPDMKGFAVIWQFASGEPCPRVVLLSEIEDRSYVERALRAGVKAYLLKRSPRECLLHAIRAAASRGVYLDPAITADFLTRGKSEDCRPAPWEGCTSHSSLPARRM